MGMVSTALCSFGTSRPKGIRKLLQRIASAIRAILKPADHRSMNVASFGQLVL
jgi:hypothetical protein